MTALAYNTHPVLAQFSVEPVFGWVALVPLAIILLASLWLYSSPGLSWRARWLLSLLRLLAMLVLLVGWLRPAVISNREKESAGAIAVLIDRSQSMVLPSDVSDRTRWEIECEVWTAIQTSTDLKIGQTVLVPFFYDGELVAAASDDLPHLANVFDKPPTGRVTDLGVRHLQKLDGCNLILRRAIVLGDGVQTLIPAPVDASVAAR